MKYIKTYKIFENTQTNMDVSRKGLSSLPKLPISLETLYCNYNKLTSLPELPDSLRYLSCYNNQLSSLPELPNTLITLSCHNNPFKEPLSKEIVDKFKLENIYTIESINLFKTYEFQKEFLERTGRIQDIEEWVLPQIKIEFDYLYSSIELGLL